MHGRLSRLLHGYAGGTGVTGGGVSCDSARGHSEWEIHEWEGDVQPSTCPFRPHACSGRWIRVGHLSGFKRGWRKVFSHSKTRTSLREIRQK